MKEWVAVCGPTGSGKSALALALAEAVGGEIVGCDSVQLYKGFDIGSAKPTAAERLRVPHHLVDVLDWQADCDAALYAQWAIARIADIRARGRVAIVAGGTGLYLRALLGRGWSADLPKDEALRERLRGEASDVLFARLTALDPERAAELHPNDRFRVVRALELVTLLGKPLREAGVTAKAAADPTALVVILEPPRVELHQRLEARTHAMLASGLVEETRALLAAGVPDDCKPMRSIGYKEVVQSLRGELPPDALAERITAATRQYAKRQGTWFRKVDADARMAHADTDAVTQLVRASLSI